MFSTISLLFLFGFFFWMNTSKRIAWPDKNPIMSKMASNVSYSRYAAGVLFLVAVILCVISMGLGSGIFAATVILMAAGSVSVLFFPFHYIGPKGLAVLYVCCLTLELILS